MGKDDYIDFLYWELYRKDHIDFHALMELFKERYGRYPYFDEVITFKIDFHDTWYKEIDKYLDEE